MMDDKELHPNLVKFLQDFPWANGKIVLSTLTLGDKNGENKQPYTVVFDKGDAMKAADWAHAACFAVKDLKNVYFTPNGLRDYDKVPRKLKETDIYDVSWVIVDLDARAQEDLAAERTRLIVLAQDEPALKEKGLPGLPTFAIMTGNGVQLAYCIREPFITDGDKAKIADVKLYGQGIENALITLGADDCHSIEHLFRLPFTRNNPDAKKAKKGRIAVIAELIGPPVWDRMYDWSQIEVLKAQSVPEDKPYKPQIDPANVKPVGDVNTDPRTKDLSDRVKVILVQGLDPDRPKRGDNSRSAWLHDACCNMVREGCDDATLYSIITDRTFGISASVVDKGKPDEYAKRQITRAHEVCAAPDWVQGLNRDHAIIKSHGGKLRVLYEKPDGSLDFMGRDDFKAYYEHDRVQIGTDKQGNAKYAPKGHAWFMHPAARRYDYITFLPRETPGNVYNLFRGWSVTPVEGDVDDFLYFAREIICNGDDTYYNYLMDWSAHLFQKPEEPGQIAVVLRGQQGAGKGFFILLLGSLLGQHFYHVKSVQHLLGNFNAHLRAKLLVFGDEVFGTSEQSARGVLKAMVTETSQEIEGKGIDVFEEARYFRLMLSSNEGWAVPAELDDRRFFILDVVHPLQDDEQTKSDYFAALSDWADHGGREHLLYYLLHRDISKFNHRLRPHTAALVSQQLMTLSTAQKVVYTGLRNGTLTVQKVDGERVFVSARLLREQHDLKIEQETTLGRELGKAAGDKSQRAVVDGKQVRGYWLPPLTIARTNWAQAHGLRVHWPDDPDSWESAEEPCEV